MYKLTQIQNLENYSGAQILEAFPLVDNTRYRARAQLCLNFRASEFINQFTPDRRPNMQVHPEFRDAFPEYTKDFEKQDTNDILEDFLKLEK